MEFFKKEDMYQYLPENGRLLDAMRKQLISALGENHARGFLVRYGWNCGHDFANHLFSLDLHNKLSKTELIQLASSTHSELTNMETIVYERTFDPNNQNYYSEGIWKYSQEAIKYIEVFGLAEQPVCHTLTGFISSFISAIVGETIIFKELTCRAQGHKGCHWVGQSISSWANEIDNELSYFRENNSFFELESAFEQLQEKNEVLSRALVINELLSNKIIEGAGYKGLIETLAHETQCDVLVENIDFKILFANTTSEYDYTEDYAYIKQHKLTQPVPKKQVVQSTITKADGQTYHRLTTQIYTRNQLVSYLTLIKHDHYFTNLDFLILEKASMLYALQISREIETSRNTQLIHNELLTRFFEMDKPSESIIEQIRLLGYQIEQPQYVFLFQFNDQGKKSAYSEEQLISLKNKKIEKLYQIFSSYRCDCLIATQLYEIILLVPERFVTDNFKSLLLCAEYLMEQVFKTDSQMKPSLAISTCCTDLYELKNHVEEAQKVMQLMNFSPKPQSIHTFEQLGALAPILCKENYTQLLRFADEQLLSLQKYDATHQSELLATLYWYLYHQGHLKKTAQETNCSLGSVRYRLKRIEELANCSLKVAQQTFDLHIAMQVYLVSGKFSLAH